MSGDNENRNFKNLVIGGSPPHEWGQLAVLLPKRLLTTVHPHMSGDNFEAKKTGSEWDGSPPHEWGQ